jgi:hypothetical protein
MLASGVISHHWSDECDLPRRPEIKPATKQTLFLPYPNYDLTQRLYRLASEFITNFDDSKTDMILNNLKLTRLLFNSIYNSISIRVLARRLLLYTFMTKESTTFSSSPKNSLYSS